MKQFTRVNIFCILFLLVSFSLRAQESVIQPEYKELSRSQWRKLLLNDRDPKVIDFISRSKSTRRTGKILLGVGTLGLVTGVSLTTFIPSSLSPTEEMGRSYIGLITTAASGGVLLSSGLFFWRAEYLFQKAKSNHLQHLTVQSGFSITQRVPCLSFKLHF